MKEREKRTRKRTTTITSGTRRKEKREGLVTLSLSAFEESTREKGIILSYKIF